MRKLALHAPSRAMVVALIALFIALGGTGYAAFSLPKNSVGTKQLKNGAVTGKKLGKGAVSSNNIANGAVTSSKLNLTGVTSPNALHANSADSATNATNAANATNATALGGAPASAFLGRTVVVVTHGPAVAAGSFGSADAMCPANYEAVGGGVSPNNVLQDKVTGSFPLLTDATPAHDPNNATDGTHSAANGWRGFIAVTSNGPDTFAVVAVCAKAGP